MLFKRTRTKPIPEGATVTRTRSGKLAKWKDSRGRRRQAPVTEDGSRVLLEDRTWTARYTTATGRLIQRPTGCENREAAEHLLSEWLAQEEKVRAGILTPGEAVAADHAYTDIDAHVADFEAHMTAKRLHKNHVKVTASYCRRVFEACHARRLQDLDRAKVERWIVDQVNEGMGARTANAITTALSGFGTWAMKQGRMTANIFARMTRYNEAADPRRPRRAFTPEELAALFEAAERRPLHEVTYKETRRKDKSEPVKAATLDPETVDNLEWRGRVRSLAYQTLAYTGLRLAELRSITLGQCRLDHEPPFLELKAKHEKAKRGARIPLPAFLAHELTQYVTERKKRLRGDCGAAFPRAFDKQPLFSIPANMTKPFNRDLIHAGLAHEEDLEDGRKRTVKTDRRGESVDIHSLRHSFVSELAKSGASMVTVAKAARHADPRITLKVYSHVGLEELAQAVEGMAKIAHLSNLDAEGQK